MVDSLAHLERLARLKESGHLTEAEFVSQKERLLDAVHPLNLASSQELWNPTAAVNWSLLFTPFFGMFIHWRNWIALREPAQANKSLIWICFGAFMAVALVLASAQPERSLGVFGLLLLISWYYLSAQTQIAFVRLKWAAGYKRRSWLTPIIVSLATFCVVGAANTFSTVGVNDLTGLPYCDSNAAVEHLVSASNGSPGAHLTGVKIVTVKEMRPRIKDSSKCIGRAYLNNGQDRQIYYQFERLENDGSILTSYEIPSL